jgi:hypothetical protein
MKEENICSESTNKVIVDGCFSLYSEKRNHFQEKFNQYFGRMVNDIERNY